MSRDPSPAAEALAALRDAIRPDDGGHAGATFMRGLTLGALLGAAIAGSALWQRRHRRDRSDGTPSR